MTFETERLIARPWRLDDADVSAAYRMYSDPEVMRFLGRNGASDVVTSLEEQRERLEKFEERYRTLPELQGWFVNPLELKATQEVVGVILLQPLPDANDVYTSDWQRLTGGLATPPRRRRAPCGWDLKSEV